MDNVVKGFVCKEYWTDEEKRKRSKMWGRRYHVRAAADLPDDHIVNVCEVHGDEN